MSTRLPHFSRRTPHRAIIPAKSSGSAIRKLLDMKGVVSALNARAGNGREKRRTLRLIVERRRFRESNTYDREEPIANQGTSRAQGHENWQHSSSLPAAAGPGSTEPAARHADKRQTSCACRLHRRGRRFRAATHLIVGGTDVRTTASVLGHTTPTVTLTINAHLVAEVQRVSSSA
jgi:hypothetical protein